LSSATERIKLYSAFEIIGKHFSKFFIPADMARPTRELEIAKSKGEIQEEGWRVRGDGSRFWAYVVITSIWDDAHRLKGFSKITRDMSEKKKVEDELKRAYDLLDIRVTERTFELQQTKHRLELALDVAQMGTWNWDLSDGKLICSEALRRLFGFPAGEIPTGLENFLKRVHPEDRARVEGLINQAVHDRDDYDAEYRVVWVDGTIHWISAKGKTLCDPTGKAVRMIGTAISIDKRKRSQEMLEQLVQSRTEELSRAQAVLLQTTKMSALGEMAGGIAHEINTPLASITMKAQQLERRSNEESVVPQEILRKESHLIGETAKRIGVIIDGLRTFAREGSNDPFVEVSASQIVENVLALCQTRFRSYEIAIRYTPPSPELTLACRLVPIEQVLLNLLSNSFHAVQNFPEKWIEIDVLDRDLDIDFRLEDSGLGIPETIMAKIMQPFFTTKGIGKGTGLGLSISKGIVENHHGSLMVDSTSVHTCFVVRLPKAQLDRFIGGQDSDQSASPFSASNL
jgi:PAS domain S-box-containing protein